MSARDSRDHSPARTSRFLRGENGQFQCQLLTVLHPKADCQEATPRRSFDSGSVEWRLPPQSRTFWTDSGCPNLPLVQMRRDVQGNHAGRAAECATHEHSPVTSKHWSRADCPRSWHRCCTCRQHVRRFNLRQSACAQCCPKAGTGDIRSGWQWKWPNPFHHRVCVWSNTRWRWP